MKFCKKCGGSDFRKHGTSVVCADCRKERSRIWAEQNKDKRALYAKKDMEKHGEKRRAKQREYHHKNKDERNLKNKEYREKNIEQWREKAREWAKNNKVAHRLHSHTRRARLRNSGGSLSVSIVSQLLKLQKNKCACCGIKFGDKYHVDHIYPISKGGKNIDSNVQLLCQPCNQSKHAKDPIEFMQSRGFLL